MDHQEVDQQEVDHQEVNHQGVDSRECEVTAFTTGPSEGGKLTEKMKRFQASLRGKNRSAAVSQRATTQRQNDEALTGMESTCE